MRLHHVPAAAALLASIVDASTLTPPVLPLIVRNPYLSTWLPGARGKPWDVWPKFWQGGDLGLSVFAHLPDTKEVFPLLGRPQDSLDKRARDFSTKEPTYGGAQYDASTTNLTYTLPSPPDSKKADLKITLSFLSPITPTSTLRQSIPAAYLTIHVEGNFDVDIYVDVNGKWVSGNGDNLIQWELAEQEPIEAIPGLKTWKIKRQIEQLFTEDSDQAEWGELLFTGPADARHESGESGHLRQRFAQTGMLQDQVDNNFRAIFDNEPVFAFSKSFELAGSASANSSSVLFTIAHVQEPIVQFASEQGLTFMRPLWNQFYPEGRDTLVQYHYGDFANANGLASTYSEQLRIDAYKSGSDNYVDIVALSARQVMGATSFSGTPENPLLFLKEISSNGNTQTVDVIFPAFPFFLYTQPKWGAYLLQPLLEHQNAHLYPNDYSMHDLGAHFPNLTGHWDGIDEYMPVEECGDMLIMALALINSFTFDIPEKAQSIWSTVGAKPGHVAPSSLSSNVSVFSLTNLGTVDGIPHIDEAWVGGADGKKKTKQWTKKYYGLWYQWTQYLDRFSLYPANQLSTDDFAGPLKNHTNLALKGIVGLKAFSEIANLLDKPDEAKKYRNMSESYVKQWEIEGMSPDKSHAKLSYDWYGSWTTLYSLYADALLCFHPTLTNASSASTLARNGFVNGGAQSQQKLDEGETTILGRTPITTDLIPDHVYTKQSDWYFTVLQKYGLPLDSRHLYTKSDWQFEAAAVTSPETRKEILDRVATWVNETSTDLPFTDLFETEEDGGFGAGNRFTARPVVGGHFAFLSLERACGGGLGEEGRGERKTKGEIDEL